METNKLVKSRDGNYFSCDRFRQIHERLVEERQSKLYWKTTEYSQLYGLLLRGSKPSNKVKHSLFHSKDFIAGRIVPHISLIPSDVEEEVPLYGLLRCWVYGSSVDDLYADNHNTKVAELQLPSKEDIQYNVGEEWCLYRKAIVGGTFDTLEEMSEDSCSRDSYKTVTSNLFFKRTRVA
ncbi:hypothetical protein Gasu2_07970 [Galdieria sulphuraria]|nr:hypothetical protein Gasu2_07970 [Galdieria sulphuraria]